MVDAQGDDLDALARRFLDYSPPLGAYAVTGNHERFAGLENSLRFLRNAGFTVLRDEAVARGGIVLEGEDDPHAQSGRLKPDRMAQAGAGEFVVLLKHQPVVDEGKRFDLQLSGHIHGGQIYPFVYLTRMVYGVDAGLTKLPGGRLLYVSRGTGTWGPPLRVLAPPEITLITIESENKQSPGRN
jgi:predicted MPP superfamily phosphohydrolase